MRVSTWQSWPWQEKWLLVRPDPKLAQGRRENKAGMGKGREKRKEVGERMGLRAGRGRRGKKAGLAPAASCPAVVVVRFLCVGLDSCMLATVGWAGAESPVTPQCHQRALACLVLWPLKYSSHCRALVSDWGLWPGFGSRGARSLVALLCGGPWPAMLLVTWLLPALRVLSLGRRGETSLARALSPFVLLGQ